MRRIAVLAAVLVGLVGLVGCEAETEPATNVTETAATLNALMSGEEGERVHVRWAWRPVGSGSWTTSPWTLMAVGAHVTDYPMSKYVGGLAPNTTYEFRVEGYREASAGWSAEGSPSDPIWFDDDGTDTGTNYSTFTTPGQPPVGQLVKHDPMTNPDPLPLWGGTNAETKARHQWIASGGPNGGPFRRMHLHDGDDFYGERATLGRNNRFDTFYTAQEGDYLRHDFWFRLAPNYNMGYWSVIAGWKHGEPCPTPKNEGLAGENTGSAPIQLQMRPNHMQLRQNGSMILYRTQDVTKRAWHHVTLDIRFTGQSTNGSLQLTLDGVTSPVFHARTMKRAAVAGNGLAAGDTIPSLLMTGVYRNPGLSGNTHIDLANVRIYDLGGP